MTHKLDSDDYFIHRVQQECAERRLNFFLVEPLWVERFYECYSRNEVWARVLLNMHSEHHLPDDIYHRLVLLAHRRETRVIDPPDIALAAFDKERMHERLLHAGFHVPDTLFVHQNEVEAFRLSEEQRAQLGQPFVVKPSHGYGRRGVVLDAQSEADVARSAAAWPNRSYLLQRKITPRALADGPAYWRVFFVFDEVWTCWWNCYTDRYRAATDVERSEFHLDELERIVRGVASLSGMKFFSSEIAQLEDGRFMLIDYVNDQCHMLSQTADPRMGVPDPIISQIARKLVESATGMMGRKPAA